MILAAVIISGKEWLIPAVAFFAVALVVLGWSYRHSSPVSGRLRFICLLLKLVGILALTLCLLEPLRSRERARPGANLFVILADNSQGMLIKDPNAERSRGQQLQRLLSTQQAAWQEALEDTFQVRRYVFDRRLQSTPDFSNLNFNGLGSSMLSALRQIRDRYEGQPLAGVLLLTDGNATDLPDGLPDLSGLPPIYPVVLGSDSTINDVSIERVAVSMTSFEDAPVTIQASIRASGYSGQTLVAQLVRVERISSPSTPSSPPDAPVTPSSPQQSEQNSAQGSEKLVEEQTQIVSADSDSVSFRFQTKPAGSHLAFYRLQVVPQDELKALSDPSLTSEATLANNRRVLVADRGRGPYRILYVAGRPNWEYKFLRRALTADDQIQLVGLIRVARREPKFDFRGRDGESSNPLFRGFGDQSAEETERYDQPVLVRLNTKDEFELRGGFPKLPEDLFAYHAVVIDDLEAAFFTPDQLLLLQRFVSERGGGLLMLGGMESFQQGRYNRTPVGDMLPVYLGQPTARSPIGDLKLDLTREGLLQPWARLRDHELEEKRRLPTVPPFGVLNQVSGVKPGAIVVATASDDQDNRHPALAVHRFGNGRVGALMLGDLWHWGLKDESNQRDMNKAWRQFVRWLVADVPERAELLVESNAGDPNDAVTLRLRARDRKFQPLENAKVSMHIWSEGVVSQDGAPKPATPSPSDPQTTTSPVTEPDPDPDPDPPSASDSRSPYVSLSAEPALNDPSLYEATFIPRKTGGYRAEAVVTDSTGMEVAHTEVGWTADPAAAEFRSLVPNRALLQTIATQTGGKTLPAASLKAFAEKLPNQNAPITESWASPLWHQTSVFLFALACFIVEWGLRRWKGLA
jgi:uncharacterized membrane protein